MAERTYKAEASLTKDPGTEPGRTDLVLTVDVIESDTGSHFAGSSLRYSNLPASPPVPGMPSAVGAIEALWRALVSHMTKEGYAAASDSGGVTQWNNLDYTGIVLFERLWVQVMDRLATFGIGSAKAGGKPIKPHDTTLKLPF